MLGAIIGDTVGSRFEWNNIHTKDFDFLPPSCFLTDDSIMTIAIAQAILEWEEEGSRAKRDYSRLSFLASWQMREWGTEYPDAGYGGAFCRWLSDPCMGPYNSCGNGAAMRVSPVGWAARDLEECVAMSKAVTEVSHNHPDGIMGAESTAVQIFLARKGLGCSDLKEFENSHWYPMEHDIAWLQRNYTWQDLCNGTCQAAFACLYESKGFEDAIRNCMSIGGDCDTTGAICGGIAEAVWGIPKELEERIYNFMSEDQWDIVEKFRKRFVNV